MQDDFDFELVCGACGATLGTFVRCDDFADEPHACPRCHSRHLERRTPSLSTEWRPWLPEGGRGLREGPPPGTGRAQLLLGSGR